MVPFVTVPQASKVSLEQEVNRNKPINKLIIYLLIILQYKNFYAENLLILEVF